jgi:hypothetical protein
MHDAPQLNGLPRPTPAKVLDSLVALAMERFNGTPNSVYQKGFSADFCEQGPKLIFRIQKSSCLGGGRQIGEVFAVR